MKIKDIRPGRMYRKGASRRWVASWGRDEKHVCWAASEDRLPLGGVTGTRCTTTASFARWAEEDVTTQADLSRGKA